MYRYIQFIDLVTDRFIVETLLIYESGTLNDKHITAEDGALERTRYVSGKLVWCRIDATLNDLFGYVRSVRIVQEMSSCYLDVGSEDDFHVNVNKLYCFGPRRVEVMFIDNWLIKHTITTLSTRRIAITRALHGQRLPKLLVEASFYRLQQHFNTQ